MFGNPFVFGPPALPEGVARHSMSALLGHAGYNTGNLLFQEAIRRVLDYDGSERRAGFDPDQVRERHDCIVMPAANWLSARVSLAELADKVEAAGLPLIIVGIGAQARSEGQIPELQEGVLRLVRMASETSASISVRGKDSAAVLEHYGIANTAVTGCPSLLWNVAGPPAVRKPDKRIERVVLNCSRGLPTESVFTTKLETMRLNLLLSRLALRRDLDFVAQAELPDLYHALVRREEDPYGERFPGYLQRVYDEDDEERIGAFLRRRMKVFFSVEPWVEYLAEQDFVVGTRLHGAIAALLAGTPAVLLTHDSRTSEMAREARLPTFDSRAFTKNADFQAIYDACEIEPFNERAPLYQRRFGEFFEANGLRHRLPSAAPGAPPPARSQPVCD